MPGRHLSVSRRCTQLAMRRSTPYYAPQGHSAETLALWRRVSEWSIR